MSCFLNHSDLPQRFNQGRSIRDLDFQTLDSFNTPQNLIEFDIFRLFASEKLLEAQQRFCDLILRNSKLKLLPKLSDGIFFTMSDSLL
jgi:hypothetical protein